MKRLISIAGALILLVGLTVALAAWWMLASENSDLAAEVAALRQENAKLARLEQALADQELDFATKLSELARKDSNLNAFLKKLLAETAVAEDKPASPPERKPILVSDLRAAKEAPVEPELEARKEVGSGQRQELSWQDDHNADGVIDDNDLVIVHNLANKLSQEGDEDFVPAADMDGDGVISLNDTVGLWRLLQQQRQQQRQTNPE